MNALTLIGRITQARYQQWSQAKPKPVRTKTPLGLHQDSIVELPLTELTNAQGDGGLFPDFPETTLRVVAVGSLRMLGRQVFRSYLQDGTSFIQTVADLHDPSKAVETHLYALNLSATPQNSEDIAFFIGRAAVMERVELSGFSGYRTEERVKTPAVKGLIGAKLFALHRADGEELDYERSWTPDGDAVAPVTAQESIADAAGGTFTASHNMMHYSRMLADGSTLEHMFVDMIESESEVQVVAHVGTPLNPVTLKVFPSAM